MDKNTFGTYEYLHNNNSAMDTDEFLVVQDDGTFLLNRQVQYVAQVQDVKEVLENSEAVYDVSSQQYFVDVADNSSELISVADNYILPQPLPAQDERNNLYNNSFLIQVVSNENSEQADKNLPSESKEKASIVETNIITQKVNTCTEITLTDEQYNTLEQKGCVLLEGNNKLFILDAYGLHEVAADNELISSLKSDSSLDENTSITKKESVATLINTENSDPLKTELDVEENTLAEYELIQNNDESSLLDVKDESTILSKGVRNDISSDSSVSLIKPEISNKLRETAAAIKDIKRQKHIKIKTKYSSKDIPDRIVIGKTAGGKNIVAKVVKRTPTKRNIEKSSLLPPEKRLEANKPDASLHLVKETVKRPNDSEFEWLVQLALHSPTERGAERVRAAREIVAQLFHVPAIQASVTGRNLIVTKVIEKSKKNRRTSIITGVVTANEDGSCCFTHDPELLQGLITKYIEHKTSESPEAKAPDLTILHVNISESKYENNVETISVVLNEHVLPCDTLTTRPHVHKLHACSSCAAIFQSQAELEEHQETHMMEAEDALTIDTDKLSLVMYPGNQLCTERTEKGIEYTCYQCPMKFTKLSNYTKHIETHGDTPTSQDRDSETQSGKTNRKQPLYRCKMCNCSYFYPSTLAKHISTVHIKSKVIFTNDNLNPNSK